MFPSEIQVKQNPAWFQVAKAEYSPRPEDVAIVLGYQAFSWKMTENIHKDGSACILTCSHAAPAEFLHRPKNVYLQPFWGIEDASVEVKGYDVKILLISGVMQAAIYRQLVELSAYGK